MLPVLYWITSVPQKCTVRRILLDFQHEWLTFRSLEFGIREVFSTLYKNAYLGIEKRERLPSAHLVAHYMDQLYARLRKGRESVVELHRLTMSKHKTSWKSVRGITETCFVCLRRKPEYHLDCSHIVCLGCVKDFGVQEAKDGLHFRARNCFLCLYPCDLVVYVRPPTAGIGLLCLEGGGVRGIQQTCLLQRLEERIGLPIPVQEHFQLAAGVSAGKCTVPCTLWTCR